VELLGRVPHRPAPTAKTLSTVESNDLRIEKIQYQLPYGPPTEALFLTPLKATGKLPAVLALHDHGGFKYYGKEKITDQPDDASRPALQPFRDLCYGGHAWASALARRGFAVLVNDVFPWGSRRIRIEDFHPDLQQPFAQYKPGSAEYIRAYNASTGPTETEIYKGLCCAGATFMGLVAYEDQCALDYLATRSEINPDRIGCGGLSGGGLRSLVLAGLDARIKASFVAGFMPTVQGTSYGLKLNSHTMMAFIPNMAQALDFPDILSIGCPNPTFVLQCRDDDLFTLSAMKAADQILKEIYARAGHPDRYQCTFYPLKHMLTPPMQDDAFAFFDKWLKV
jgi:dienelactone hydrolase